MSSESACHRWAITFWCAAGAPAQARPIMCHLPNLTPVWHPANPGMRLDDLGAHAWLAWSPTGEHLAMVGCSKSSNNPPFLVSRLSICASIDGREVGSFNNWEGIAGRRQVLWYSPAFSWAPTGKALAEAYRVYPSSSPSVVAAWLSCSWLVPMYAWASKRWHPNTSRQQASCLARTPVPRWVYPAVLPMWQAASGCN